MDYKWNLSDLKSVKKNGYKVFSCFSCWWWSSMWYKNAWYDVIWTCEIDPQMHNIYIKNFWRWYNYLMGVQDFKKIPDNELPSDLFDIDLLDWSPPCSTFSVAWLREKWRWKEKVFREWQAKQVLSDLFFDYLDIVEKLHPKVVIAENVKWMLTWNAKWYLKLIFERFNELWYNVQLFLLNWATMWLPQKRQRVFFTAHRKEFDLPKLKLSFNEKPILYKEIKDKSWKIDRPISKSLAIRIKYARYWDMALDSADERYRWWNAFFNCRWLYDDKVCPTITGQDKTLVWWENRFLNNSELILAGSFPQDYDFGDIQPTYLIWMSVPPLMMYKLSNEIRKQRLDLIYKK